MNENEVETKDNFKEEPQEMYYVVRNIEDQYSIWPSYKQIPKGWEAVGNPRIKAECLAYIEVTWTDMRPLSLRKHMEEIASKEKEEISLAKKNIDEDDKAFH